MSTKSDRIFFILIRVFLGVAAVGLIVLIGTNFNKDPSTIAFSLIAFILSVAALIMTTLQSISIARQVRITKRAAELVRETEEQIRTLIKEEHVVEREIRKDLAVDQEIVSVLEEYGIGNNEHERRKVAATIAARVGQKKKK